MKLPVNVYKHLPIGIRRWIDGQRAKSNPVVRGQLPDFIHNAYNERVGLQLPRGGINEGVSQDEEFSLRVIKAEENSNE